MIEKRGQLMSGSLYSTHTTEIYFRQNHIKDRLGTGVMIELFSLVIHGQLRTWRKRDFFPEGSFQFLCTKKNPDE